ncbi:translation initiation factor eIF2A [Encephalitozoon hellem]|uniref:Translation initiation factor eIF2A n=1 Tax=Encephalitozoon hellem TaxID=27973 RepID=A0ABY8CQI3_ENCHE|nr:translation initiation factor eIF2A [Encephalitozoon hellem]
MPAVAHCENGLTFDVFAENASWVGCDYYALKSGKAAWIKGNQVKYYDLKDKKMILETEMERPREIEMSDDGKNVGVANGKGEMVVFGKDGVMLKVENVSKFRISNTLVGYVSNSSFFIHQIKEDKIEECPFHTSKVSILEFFISGEFVFLATRRLEKDGMHRLLRISKSSVEVLHSLKELQGFTLKAHESGRYVLLLLMTSYVNNSYFPESDLYLHDIDRRSFKSLGYSPVHSYAFLSSGFVVCHGPQPSDVSVHELDGKLKYNFPEGTRNRVFFNQHENVAVFAGFDNLSGDIEVFHAPSRKLIAKFNVLGASLVNWKENGSYFYISTTSYFQEDNKITLYDYYGRKVDERRFESLFSSSVYGETEEFIEIEKPEKLNIEIQEKYVPPSIHSFIPKAAFESNVAKKQERARQQKPNGRTKDEILSDLKEIEGLKGRMKNGEELSVKELNLILRESKLKSDLKSLGG